MKTKRNIHEVLMELIMLKWNYTRNDKLTRIIHLFYNEGGFKGILEFLKKENLRMGETDFNYYYGSGIQMLVDELIKFNPNGLTLYQFVNHIVGHSDIKYEYINFNIINFNKLFDLGLLEDFINFNDSFRGNIQKVHKFNEKVIYETICDNESNFYLKGNFTNVYNDLNECYLSSIIEETYLSSVFLMYKNSFKDK